MGWVHLGFLGALVALVIPIIVHLVYGRRARRVELGTLRFLQIVLRENIRRRRLKRWLLLALRMACIALLAALFARPYLIARETGGESRLLIVLVDRSASMGLKTGGERLLDAAIRQAKKIAAQAGEGTQIEAAWFDHTIHPLNETGNDGAASGSRASLADRLTALASAPVLHGTTDYGTALAWAGDVATQSRRAQKELYLFTDLQRSGLDRTAASPLPADLQVRLVDLGRAYPGNVAVTSVTLPKLVARPGETMTMSVTLRNTGPFAREKVPVNLRLENSGAKRDFRSQAELDAGGTATVRFELPALPEGFWQGSVAAEIEDDLAFDNRRHVGFLVAGPINVILVDGAPGDSPVASETYFLETAIRLAEPSKTFAASPFTTTVAKYEAGSGLPELKKGSLVVLANVGSLGAADSRRLAEYVRQGGRLLVFTGENVQPAGCRELAAAGLVPGQVRAIVQADALPWRLEQWDLFHPALRPFSDPQYGDLRRPAFRAYTRLQPSDDAKVLARFRGGDPALVEHRLGNGKILWFTTACDLDWSDWPRSRLYVPLVHQMLSYLAGLTEGGPVRSVALDEQAGESQDAEPGVFARDGYQEIVNTDPRESESDRVTIEQFAARFKFDLPEGEETPQGPQTAQAVVGDQMRPDEIWHWVILGLLGFVLAEGFLANRTTA